MSGFFTFGPDEGSQEPYVVLGNRGVEDTLEQERRNHTERGGEDDQGEDDRELRPIGAEERKDAAEVCLAYRGIGRSLRRLG